MNRLNQISLRPLMMLTLRAWRIFFFVALIFTATGEAHAQIETEAQYAILLDVETKTVLFEKKADELMEPASMSKLMTLALVFEALEAGKITMDTEFTVSLFAWKTGGAPSRTPAMFAPLNTQVRVQDLINGVIVQSGNDACIILAEGIAGSEDAFVGMMNEYAHKIGLTKSTFGNSTGLPHPNQRMTARELAMLALHIIEKYPKYYPLFAQKEFRYRSHMFYNRDPLLSANIGADGLKTGFTEGGGYGLVGSAVQDGRRLIIVQNGVQSQGGRKEDGLRMVNWGFRNFEKFTLFNAGETVGDALIWGGQQRYVKLRGVGGAPLQVLLPKNAKAKKLAGKIIYKGPLKPPLAVGDAGEKVGNPTLHVTADGGISASAPLEVAEVVEKSGVVWQGLDSLFFLTFGWFIHHI